MFKASKIGHRFHELATGDEEARLCRDIPEQQCSEQPGNFGRLVVSNLLSKTGDVLADPKLVLPWLLGAAGAPAYFVGMLVPIRESLALLPQILIGGVIRHYPVRKWFWVVSSLLQGCCILFMGLAAAAGLSGSAAGWTVVGLLVLFSLARGVASVSSKDTLGKTVSKGRRGRVSGIASTGAGAVAIGTGLYLALAPDGSRPDWVLHAMLVLAAAAWTAAAMIFATVREFPGATEGSRRIGDLAAEQFAILWRDRELQKFLVARALMVSTALAAPVYVALAQRETGMTLDGLGWLLLATGAANLSSAWIWGWLSDRSSRLAMALGAIFATAVAAGLLMFLRMAPSAGIGVFAVSIYLARIAYSGVRIGRKTHIVDLADRGQKAEYVALSNTMIGLMLIGSGAVASTLLAIDPELALGALAAMSLCGAIVALSMKGVQARQS